MNLINALQNNKILDQTKAKAFEDNKINIAPVMVFVVAKAKNIVGNRRKCWLPSIFSYSQQCFLETSSVSLKLLIVW